jgi:hypothetical protein
MRNFYNPASGSVFGMFCFLSFFLMAAVAFWNETPYYYRFQGRFAGGPFIKAHMLRVAEYIGTFNADGF